MVNQMKAFVRTYPVTLWLGVGVFSYVWKATMASTVYGYTYQKWEEERIKELQNVQ